jgi:hypothetical protein
MWRTGGRRPDVDDGAVTNARSEAVSFAEPFRSLRTVSGTAPDPPQRRTLSAQAERKPLRYHTGAGGIALVLTAALALAACRPDGLPTPASAAPTGSASAASHDHPVTDGSGTPTGGPPTSSAVSASPSASVSASAAQDGSATVSAGGILANPSPGNGLPATITVPKGAAGFDEMRVRNITGDLARAGLDIGAFRVTCEYSHMGFDDPIVKPNQPGGSHLHTFFGNTGTTAASTPDSIATSGRSTCAGGIANRSAYWVPTLYDTRTGAPIIPSFMIVYYKTGYNGVKPSDVVAPPARLRMVAGDPNATGEQPYIHWGCLNGGGSGEPGTIPTGCRAGEQELTLAVGFPQCWNGKDLDAPDHKSHMSYPYGGGGGCPASHPVAIPEITINLRFDIKTADEQRFWRLSSDMYDKNLPGGRSAHGDWMNGWDPAVEKAWVENCNHKAMDCSYQLGDGRELY